MTYPAHERRKHARLDKNIPLKISSDDFDIVTQTDNLSPAGAYCKVDRYLEPMTKLKINLLLPLRRYNKITTKKVVCEGVVVRTEPAAQSESYHVAIYFSDVPKPDMKILIEFVQSSLVVKAGHG